MLQNTFNYVHKSLLPNNSQLNDLWNSITSVWNSMNFQRWIKDKILSILSISSSRHDAKWNDTDVFFLNKLELEYMLSNSILLDKVKSITIESDIIRIAWLEISRFDLNSQNEHNFWVYNSANLTAQFYNYNAAVRLLNNSWLNLISQEQLWLIIDAIPCENDDFLPHYLINILNFSIGWFRSKSSGNIIDTKTWHYWLLDESTELWYYSSFSINKEKYYSEWKHSSNNALLVRWIRQKTILN